MSFFAAVWDVLLWALLFTVFIGYLMALFAVIMDLFRDHTLNGWLKALWFIFLIIFPLVTVLVYLIFRGRGMTNRSVAAQQAAQQAADDYIRQVAGSPADSIAQAKSLLDSGAINQEEFEHLKRKALAS